MKVNEEWLDHTIRGYQFTWGEILLFLPYENFGLWPSGSLIPRVVPETLRLTGLFTNRVPRELYETWEDARVFLRAVKVLTGSFPEGFPVVRWFEEEPRLDWARQNLLLVPSRRQSE